MSLYIAPLKVPATTLTLYHTLLVVRGGAVSNEASKTLLQSMIGGMRLGSLPDDEARSVSCMAVAMALHYLGYSFARPTTIALFTSKSVGFQSPSAFPFAMALISPVSLCLLLLYGTILEHNGPRAALSRTTALCGSMLLTASLAIYGLQQQHPQPSVLGFPIVKLLVGALFIFRESYVQLLTSQHWSFMASITTPDNSATWFPRITGLTSILSATGGWFTSALVNKVGLTGVVALAGLSLFLSLFMSNQAYSIAKKVRIAF